ncbi:MAG TPA: signal peptide peptidase SppA [Stellaceae bacterium]|jgi:protease-4
MRRFIVGLLATIGFLVFLVIGGGIAAWYWFKPSHPGMPDSVVLTLDLTKAIPEAPPDNPLSRLLTEDRLSLRDILDALDRGGDDQRVKGVVARIGDDDMGFGKVQELRDAVQAFRAKGKFAIAFAETYGEFGSGGTRSYYLATAFDQIWLQPLGEVGLIGVRSESPFFRGLLEKLDIEPRLDHRSEYKSAMNMITEKAMTPPHREEVQAVLSSVFGQIVRDVAKARGIEEAEVRRLVDGAPYLADDALHNRLVDQLGYRDDAMQAAQQRAGGAVTMRLAAYLDRVGPNRDGPTIALIYANGLIQRGNHGANPLSEAGVVGSDTMVRAFRAAAADPAVRAILFRVDSPGGSAVASETIWREVVRVRKAGKPVIVSMGDVAGSGGYYIAAAADKIVAHPATLTGSIGVVAGKILTAGAWAKLGVTWDAVQIGQNASMSSTIEDFTPDGKQRFETFLDAVYAGFKDRVAQGRNMSPEAVEAVAKGRAWSGEDAKANGLVDALGGYDVALRLAKEAARLPADAHVALKTYPPEEDPREYILARLFGRDRDSDGRPPGVAAEIGQALAWVQQLALAIRMETGATGVLSMPPEVLPDRRAP